MEIFLGMFVFAQVYVTRNSKLLQLSLLSYGNEVIGMFEIKYETKLLKWTSLNYRTEVCPVTEPKFAKIFTFKVCEVKRKKFSKVKKFKFVILTKEDSEMFFGRLNIMGGCREVPVDPICKDLKSVMAHKSALTVTIVSSNPSLHPLFNEILMSLWTHYCVSSQSTNILFTVHESSQQ